MSTTTLNATSRLEIRVGGRQKTISAVDLEDNVRLESVEAHVALYVGGSGSKVLGKGYNASATAAGLQSVAETHERESPAVILAMQSIARTFGDVSHAISNMLRSQCSTNGRVAHAVCCSELSHAKVTGVNSVAVCLGPKSKAYAESGGAIVLAHWSEDCELLGVKSSMVGYGGIDAGFWYELDEMGGFVKAEPPRPFELGIDKPK